MNFCAAGMIVFRRNHHDIEFLLLKNSQTGDWESPKGLVDSAESILEAAFRELREETGFRRSDVELMPIVPRSLTYSSNDKVMDRKTVVFFVVELVYQNCKENVRLSTEHSRYQWCALRECQEFVPHTQMKRLLVEMHSAIAYSDSCRRLSRIASKQIITSMRSALENQNIDSAYVIGSVASEEVTVFHDYTCLSDVDILIRRERKIYPKEQRDFFDYLNTEPGFQSLSTQGVGIYFISADECLQRYSNIFWDIFWSKGMLLVGDDLRVRNSSVDCSKVKIHTFLYSVFRIIWYLFYQLSYQSYGQTQESYRKNSYALAKSVLLSLSVYNSYCGIRFEGYRHMLNNLECVVNNKDGPFCDEFVKTVFHAFVYKLAPTDNECNWNWFPETKRFLSNFIDWISCNVLCSDNGYCRDSDYVIYDMILATKSCIYGEPDHGKVQNLMRALDTYRFFPNTLNTENFLSARVCLTAIWLVRWPEETKHAYYKYENRMLMDAIHLGNDCQNEVKLFLDWYKQHFQN